MSRSNRPRHLLLQVRRDDDPMISQEVGCFAWALGCEPSEITPHNVTSGPPTPSLVDRHDLVLVGGSGDFSVAEDKQPPDWLEATLDTLRQLHATNKPTFASCWGFQAFCRALEGRCVHDLENAELGTVSMNLTEEGAADTLFCSLQGTFLAHSGHEDRVDLLPADSLLLASSRQVANQAIRFRDKPIYATQFHPELNQATFTQRVAAYPRYVEAISGLPLAEFCSNLHETPDANQLLQRFADMVLS